MLGPKASYVTRTSHQDYHVVSLELQDSTFGQISVESETITLRWTKLSRYPSYPAGAPRFSLIQWLYSKASHSEEKMSYFKRFQQNVKTLFKNNLKTEICQEFDSILEYPLDEDDEESTLSEVRCPIYDKD